MRISGLFCVKGVLRIFNERKLSNLPGLLVLSPVNMKNPSKRPAKLSTASPRRPVNMQHSLIDPAKLHVFGGSRRHQKMLKNVI